MSSAHIATLGAPDVSGVFTPFNPPAESSNLAKERPEGHSSSVAAK